MSSSIISQRYAQALYQLAGQQNVVDAVHQDAVGALAVLKDAKGMAEFVHNPLLPEDARRKVLAALFTGKVQDVFLKFLFYVNAKNRLNLLPDILEAVDALYLKTHNQVRARIQTPLPLDENVKNTIRTQLSRKYGKDVVPQWQIRKDLLGGFRIFIEGNLHDYSFTSQLEQFKQEASH